MASVPSPRSAQCTCEELQRKRVPPKVEPACGMYVLVECKILLGECEREQLRLILLTPLSPTLCFHDMRSLADVQGHTESC